MLEFDVISGKLRRTLRGPEHKELLRLITIAYCGPVISPDGRLLAVGEQTNQVNMRVFRLTDGLAVDRDRMCPNQMGWSADGKLLRQDWDGKTWTALDLATGTVAPVAPSAAGHVRVARFADASNDVVLKNAVSGEEQGITHGSGNRFRRCIASWDGRVVACVQDAGPDQWRVLVFKAPDPSFRPRNLPEGHGVGTLQ